MLFACTENAFNKVSKTKRSSTEKDSFDINAISRERGVGKSVGKNVKLL